MIYLSQNKRELYELGDTDFPGSVWMYNKKREAFDAFFGANKVAGMDDDANHALVHNTKKLFRTKFTRKRSTL